jgi:hypothetical protein
LLALAGKRKDWEENKKAMPTERSLLKAIALSPCGLFKVMVAFERRMLTNSCRDLFLAVRTYARPMENPSRVDVQE